MATNLARDNVSASDGGRAATKKRKQEFDEAMQELNRQLNVGALLEKFAKLGEGYEDFISYIGECVSLKAETLVIRKAIECVLAANPTAWVRAARSQGEYAGEKTRDVDTVLSELINCDSEAILKCYIPRLGVTDILLVFDNEPFEVISNYDNALKDIIKPACDFAASLQGDNKEYVRSSAWRYVRIDKQGRPAK